MQNERAFCTSECPFHLDIRDLITKIQQGRFNIAYKTYQNTVGFPGIVSALCHEPCIPVCPMKDAGGAISLKMLEKAAIQFARSREPDQYNMPPKAARIAIIGAGISGLACALRLSTKKYDVTVFEKSSRIGGHLLDLPDNEIFLADIELQFKHEKFSLILDSEITDLNLIGFDAIYIATGKDGNDFGLAQNMTGSWATAQPGIFIGGSILRAGTMTAIADGLQVSTAIEVYLKIGKMGNGDEQPEGTRLKPETIRKTTSTAIHAADGVSYTKEEAIAEAKRCLKCCCDNCVHFSPLMNYFSKFPRRITEEVEISIHPSSLDGHATLATRLLSTCNHCGLCKEVCPADIDVGEFILQSHRAMHEAGKMPWAFHEFYLRDMEFSNSEAALAMLPEGFSKARYMFFPGCQLGASYPDYVTKSYEFLKSINSDTAIMLQCCGAPADWAGDETIHSEVIEGIRHKWLDMGKPTAIFACPMCSQMFQKYLPEIERKFLYGFLEESAMNAASQFVQQTASVFDPCASRHEPDLQQTIRNLVLSAGFNLEPLPMEKNMAECCTFGGQVAIAHPPFAEFNVEKRIRQNNYPYITYCANCRDIFVKAGKPVWHILDILYGLNRENKALPDVSQRRENRLLAKKTLLHQYWNKEFTMNLPEKLLIISPELREKLNKDMILESDLYQVTEYCEQSGNKLLEQDSGLFTGHLQIGNMTYWVAYRILDDGRRELVRGYCHRMKIEEK